MHLSIPIIIWLDSNASDATAHFLIKLRDSEHVQTFTEIHPCINCINSQNKEPIFLIVSGTFALQIVPHIYECSNVLTIFVFCASMKAYTDWAIDYSDKLLMFDHEDDLLYRLWTQFEEYLQERAQQCIQQADQYKERAKQFKQSCG